LSRRQARFTQADIHRCIKAVAQSGAAMAVEVMPDGIIRIAPIAAVSLPKLAPVENRPRRVP
jgi:hypothetical protein